MELNKIKFLINSNGTYLDTILPPITANENGRTIVQVIAPFPITDIVSVNYSIRPIQATVKGSYLVPTGKFGKDVLADDYTHFQTVADWNVFEIPINAVALEYISKYRAGLVLVSFAITQLQTPYFATNYLGLFSNTQPIPATSYNDGDYFIANEYNFTAHDITWAKGDYAYFYNGKWNKGKSVLKASTPSIELPVDPSLKDAPQLEYDEDVALLLAQDLGLLTQRVSQSETDIESAENDINEIDGRVGVNETDIYNLESDVGNLQSDKADKTELVPINNELLRLEQDKADTTYVDALKDNNGWESELLGTLSNNGTIALSIINQYDEIQMYAKDTLGVIDNENIRPNLMQSGDSVYFFDDTHWSVGQPTKAFIMVDTVFGFYAPAGYTLQVVGLKYTELKAEDVSTKEVGVSVQDKLDKFDESVSLSTENDWDLETIFTEKFDNSRNGWVQVDNEIYVFGGSTFLGTGKDPLRSHELSKKSYKYNIITKQWTELAEREYHYNEQRGVYYDGKIYLFGGNKLVHGDLSYSGGNYNMVYDISTDTFTLLEEAPVDIARVSGAVLIGDDVYVFVDYKFVGTTETGINTTPYIYNITDGTWSVGTPTNTRFDRGYAYYYNGLIYVQRSLKFQAYNPTTDTWVTDLTPPTYGLVHTGLMHEYKGRLFIGSGWETAKAKNNPFIQYYDVAKDKWFVATRLEFKNHALGYGSMFLYDNKLYYIGGYSNEAEPNFNNLVRSFDLEKLQFEEIDYQRQLIQNNKVEHETKLANHEQRIDSIEAITRKQNSDIASVDDDGLGILHMGKDVAETTVTTKIDGLLLDAPQLVTNGDFSDGTTGWGFILENPAVRDLVTYQGKYSLKFRVSGQYGRIQRPVTGLTVNDKLYIYGEINATTTGVENVQLTRNDSVNELPLLNYDHTLSNTWQFLSGISTINNVSLNIIVYDNRVSDWTDIYLHRIGIFNISPLIANKQYSPLYNTTFDLMTDAQIKAQMDLWVQDGTLQNGIMSVDMDKRVTSVGKNLFDKSKYATDYAYKIAVKPSTQYTWSISALYKTYDKDMNEVSSGTNTTLTVASNVYYIAFSGIANIDTFMLVSGSVVGTYENYRSSSMYIDSGEVGYSLPNGVKDTIEFRNGQAYHVQRVKKYTLQASDINNYDTSYNEVDVIATVPFPMRYIDAVSYELMYINDWSMVSTNDYNTITLNIGKYGFNSNDDTAPLRFIVTKGSYGSLAEAQADLVGTEIYYQLAEPIETPISVIGNAMAYPNGTFLIEDVVRRSGVYNAGITVDKAIKTLDNIYKLNDDGSSTKLDNANATIAGDGLSFTHTSLSNGDFVWFDYYYQGTNVKGLSTVYYYGDKMIVSGSGTTSGKVYKIVPTVVDENIVWTKVEV